MSEVRDAAGADAEAIGDLWHDAWHEAHARIVPAELVAARTSESFARRTEAGLAAMRCTGPEGAPTGFCLVAADEVDQLYVAPAARGTGAALALLRDAEARIAAAGHARAWLIAARGNARAAAFYRRAEWTEIGPVEGAVHFGGRRLALPCLRFERSLAPPPTAAEVGGTFPRPADGPRRMR